MDLDLQTYLAQRTTVVNQALDRLLPAETGFPPVIHQAVRYSINAGGKRLRPILTLAAAEAVGGSVNAVLPAACALECIHTSSLIHDDLPAMDNDDLRRGVPTNHKVFGEAIALLAGDALLMQAFHLLAEHLPGRAAPERVLKAARELAVASGALGMVGGQAADVQWERNLLPEDPAETLEFIHRHKTGALLTASVRIGAILAEATDAELAALTNYAEYLGLAYQITDDLLDVLGDAEKLGKRIGKDAAAGKLTYPSVYGVEASRQQAETLLHLALEELQIFDAAGDPLRALAGYLVRRDH